jgi:hypothetical protein
LDRLDLWPLSPLDRIIIRIASIGFSPAAWITIALLVVARKPVFAAAFLGAAILFYGLGTLFASVPAACPRANLARYIPDIGGRLGGLIRKNVRELLSLLDPYAALILTISGTVYRFAAKPVEPDALMLLSILVVLALSTHALTLFGLDTGSSFTRYHLLPLAGWQILLAKDIAFLAVLVVLVLPLAPLAGMAAGLMALTVGHKPSVETPVEQKRWRFTGGAPIGSGIVQVFLMFGAGTLVARSSPLFLVPAVVIYVVSLFWFGRKLETLSQPE